MKKYFSFILGGLMFLQSGAPVSALAKNEPELQTKEKISTTEKIKNASETTKATPAKISKLPFIIVGVPIASLFAGTAYVEHLNSKLRKAIDILSMEYRFEYRKIELLRRYIMDIQFHIDMDIFILSTISEFPSASTIAGFVIKHQFERAYDAFQQRRNPNYTVEVRADNINETLLEKIQNVCDASAENKPAAISALEEYFHTNIIRRLDNKVKPVDISDRICFNGRLNHQILETACSRLNQESGHCFPLFALCDEIHQIDIASVEA